MGWGGMGAQSPQPSPSSSQLGPEQLPCTPAGAGSSQMSWGGVQAHPCQEPGYRGVCGPGSQLRGAAPSSRAMLGARPGCRQGRGGRAHHGAGHSQGRAWEQQDGEQSSCQHPQARSYPRSTPAPPGPPACSPHSCFPAAPSRSERPGLPLWEISCFPDCRPAGFSWMSSLPPARRPAHRVRSACHAASMSE